MFYSDKYVRMNLKSRYLKLMHNCDTAIENCKDLDMQQFWLKTKLIVTQKYQKLCSLD